LRLGNTAARRDFTYVHDTARALISLLSTDQAFGDVVNIGSDCSYSVLDLVKLIAAAMHIESFTVEKDPSRFRILDIDDFRCDNGKLCQLTNWRPTVNIDDGLAMTIQYFNENNFKWSWELSSADSNFSPRNDECLLERA
jgi:nucleoside-diphosphate-sugar epimerase